MCGRSTDEPLELCISMQVCGAEALVTVSGELDVAGGPAVEALFAEAIRASCRRIVVDASGVTFLDVAGLRGLRGGSAARSEGVEVVLQAPSRPVRRVLELAALCGFADRPVESVAGAEGNDVSGDEKRVTMGEGR